jgi:type I restriction enzyme R subunit
MFCEYSREQAIVMVLTLVKMFFLIETDITKNGALYEQQIECRDRLSRAKRWQQLVKMLTIRRVSTTGALSIRAKSGTIIRNSKKKLFTNLFPNRKEVPKRLSLPKQTATQTILFRLCVKGLARVMTL